MLSRYGHKKKKQQLFNRWSGRILNNRASETCFGVIYSLWRGRNICWNCYYRKPTQDRNTVKGSLWRHCLHFMFWRNKSCWVYILSCVSALNRYKEPVSTGTHVYWLHLNILVFMLLFFLKWLSNEYLKDESKYETSCVSGSQAEIRWITSVKTCKAKQQQDRDVKCICLEIFRCHYFNTESCVFLVRWTYPALLLLLLVLGVLAQAAHAGVAGRAVDAGHAFRRVLPSYPQVWKRRQGRRVALLTVEQDW